MIQSSDTRAQFHRQNLLALLLGVPLTLTLSGYRFGTGNHTVYLLDPLRRAFPQLLKNDQFTTQTLQYHGVFSIASAWLYKTNLIEPAFLIIYLALQLLFQIAWLKLVAALVPTARAIPVYLLSILLYQLSAAGLGLGVYHFFQDSSVLPSNIANVALLCALYLFLTNRPIPTAFLLGIAGLFHLNHALIALILFPLMEIIKGREPFLRPLLASIVPGLAIITLLSLPNLLPAAHLALTQKRLLPLHDFINLYARFRHPHHYNPLFWPLALYLSFLWPIPLAILAYRRWKPTAPTLAPRIKFIFLFFLTLQLLAFLFAGVVFISESLVQMSLFRFSIYPKLLSCIGAAHFLTTTTPPLQKFAKSLPIIAATLIFLTCLLAHHLPPSTATNFILHNQPTLLLFAAASLAILTFTYLPRLAPAAVLVLLLLIAWQFHHLGTTLDESDPDYLALARWCRDNTPVDSLFLVPPSDPLFRFEARRAIVVNFKCVPQTNADLAQWNQRLCNVLDLPNLNSLPRRYDLTQSAIQSRYDSLPDAHLQQIATQYHAHFILTARPLVSGALIKTQGRWYLYQVAQPQTPTSNTTQP